MPIGAIIRPNDYHDSVFLMRAVKRITAQPDITQAAAVMGSEQNKHLLAESGLVTSAVMDAGPNDLILMVKGASQEAVDTVLARAEEWLRPEEVTLKATASRTLMEALTYQPHANLAVISLPGEYAGREARHALEKGLHVFLFSNNVPLAEEISLKTYAREQGLIVMGPDCGTAIINGVGLGFANLVRRGSIGVIGPSGTGLQEITSLVHQAGAGISHAIGTGSNDLAEEVGGVSFLAALDALEADPGTKAIAVVAKPPGSRTLSILSERFARGKKPIAACFFGTGSWSPSTDAPAGTARTIDEVVALVLGLAGQAPTASNPEETRWNELVAEEGAKLRPEQHYCRGLFAGGTFCYQAQQVFLDAGLTVHANSPLHGHKELSDPWRSLDSSLVDMGAETFTRGRPHPMIDATLRYERLVAEAEDPTVAVVLLDFILGFNAAADPAGDMIGAIRLAKERAVSRGGYLSVVANVCGTEGDPQGLSEQVRLLKNAGVILMPSAAKAASFAATLIRSLDQLSHGKSRRESPAKRGANRLFCRRADVKSVTPLMPVQLREENMSGVNDIVPCYSELRRYKMSTRFMELLQHGPVAINIGLPGFAESLEKQGLEVVQVAWTLPAGGDREMIDLLDQLL